MNVKIKGDKASGLHVRPGATPTQALRPQDIYRLPWTLTDNVLSWLEPTKSCNLYCEGCYSRNDKNSHKSLKQIREDLETFVRLRNVDSISIAGGEPLIHPEIVEVVRMIRQDFRLKAVINTNGLALTESLLDELAAVDISGFTFHVDSGQVRPGWKKKNEIELCQLRLQLARMVARAGDISVSFNATIYPHTKHYVPDLVRWAEQNVAHVGSMVFILFRTTREDRFDYFAGDQKVKLDELVYHDAEKNPEPLQTPEIIKLIQEASPDYRPAAYLGGTIDPDSFKWLIATRFGTEDGTTVGYMGPRAMEAIQTGHHALFGRYLGYSRPSLLKQGRPTALGLASVDSGCRQAVSRLTRDAFRHPRRALKPVFIQSILVIQPIDNLEDGRENMCDGCPDMTVHEGRLVWSCRLDECKQYGQFLRAVPNDSNLVQLGRNGPSAKGGDSESAPSES